MHLNVTELLSYLFPFAMIPTVCLRVRVDVAS